MIPSCPVEFLLRNMIIGSWGFSCRYNPFFLLAALKILSLSLTFDNFNIIREYLKYTNKKLYEKYNFFYRYLLNQKIPVRVKDLKIDGNDIKKALPKIAEKKIGSILKTLLDKVFENEIENEKSSLIKEVKRLGDNRNC